MESRGESESESESESRSGTGAATEVRLKVSAARQFQWIPIRPYKNQWWPAGLERNREGLENRVCLDLCGYYVFCNDVMIFSMTTDIISSLFKHFQPEKSF